MIDPNAIVREAHAEAIPCVLNNIHTNARTSNDAEILYFLRSALGPAFELEFALHS